MGLVINENKSKIQSCRISENDLSFNGIELERVNTYKYLGMYIGFYKSMDELNYVRNICISRLKPLQILANRGNGAGIPVLRMMYISTVRSIIDYAAPVLICYSEQELKKLEIIQNRAMRIILGCPMSTRIEIMRLELNFPNIMSRIHEIVSVAAVRSIRRGEKILKAGIDTMAGIRSSLNRPGGHLRKLYRILVKNDVIKYCARLENVVRPKPWQCSRLDICITKLDYSKNEYN